MNLCEYVGFDYARSILELGQKMTYDDIARALGYKSKSSVNKIISGITPSHIRGEALWVLYTETFGRKPPHNTTQAKGTPKETPHSV